MAKGVGSSIIQQYQRYKSATHKAINILFDTHDGDRKSCRQIIDRTNLLAERRTSLPSTFFKNLQTAIEVRRTVSAYYADADALKPGNGIGHGHQAFTALLQWIFQTLMDVQRPTVPALLHGRFGLLTLDEPDDLDGDLALDHALDMDLVEHGLQKLVAKSTPLENDGLSIFLESVVTIWTEYREYDDGLLDRLLAGQVSVPTFATSEFYQLTVIARP